MFGLNLGDRFTPTDKNGDEEERVSARGKGGAREWKEEKRKNGGRKNARAYVYPGLFCVRLFSRAAEANRQERIESNDTQ